MSSDVTGVYNRSMVNLADCCTFSVGNCLVTSSSCQSKIIVFYSSSVSACRGAAKRDVRCLSSCQLSAVFDRLIECLTSAGRYSSWKLVRDISWKGRRWSVVVVWSFNDVWRHTAGAGWSVFLQWSHRCTSREWVIDLRWLLICSARVIDSSVSAHSLCTVWLLIVAASMIDRSNTRC